MLCKQATIAMQVINIQCIYITLLYNIVCRIDDVMLKSMYRFYDLERVICENGFQKDSQNLHKQIHTYQKSLFDSKSLRKVVLTIF